MSKLNPFRMIAVLALLAVVPVPQASAAQDAEPIPDPLPNPTPAGQGLVLEEFVQMPESEPTQPPSDSRLQQWARINHLGEVPDGSGRLAVPDLNGMMYLIEDGTVHEYLDVGAEFAPDFWNHSGLGTGVGFVAFHPEFEDNGKFYTVHTEARDALETETPDLPSPENAANHGVIVEWTADDPSANTFSGTYREVLRIGYATRIHGFQEINFNPNAEPGDKDYGLLYVSSGDGGAGARSDVPQDLSIPQGKILRIDPLGSNSSNGKYGIPRRNPFVDTPGALDEIYAYGLRNPHRFSWDTGGQHRMYVGNIGQHRVESIYQVRPGNNFGWSEREGPFVYKNDGSSCDVFPLPPNDNKYDYTYPVAAFDHEAPPGFPCRDSGNAVIGGFVYRGSDVPELRGKYVFGEGVEGRLFYSEASEMRGDVDSAEDMATVYELTTFNTAGERITMKELAGEDRVDLRLGTDSEGELYVLSKANGKIWKVVGVRDFAGCEVGDTTVTDVMAAENWDPVTPDKWAFPGSEVILKEPGDNPGPPRRPFEYAVLTAGPELSSTRIESEVRLDTPVNVSNRDVIIVFGYQSPTEFYYAHLSSDNTIYPHNGIFVVNNADRLRIDDQWNEFASRGAPPAVTDAEWHGVRVVHCADSGEIEVYVDGSPTPLMTAEDTSLGSGRVGFGSFDNIGRLRDLRVTGTAANG